MNDHRVTGRSRPHGDSVDPAAYADRYQTRQLATHLRPEDDNLYQAQLQSVGGYATPPPANELAEKGLVHDHVESQHWRRSVGDPSAYGTTAAADVPGVELVSGRMVNPRPRVSHPMTGMRPSEALGLPRSPFTSTRARPSDYPDDEEYTT